MASGIVDRVNGLARKVPTWAVYIVLLLPVGWMVWKAQAGMLGADPVKALEHELGETALQLLIAGLAITPLRRFAGLNLLRFRRAVGVVAFLYVALHLAVWVALDMSLLWGQMWADVIKRPYITIGMAGFLLLVPLAATSNNWSVRRLGPAWRRLHKLVYAAAFMGALHFVWLVKGIQIEPLLYLATILTLLALRFLPLARLRRA
jgi:methionine sulfoxide reductase heme-binding subunit